DMGNLRHLLASRGFSPDLQAEFLAHLIENKGYHGEFPDPHDLEHLLDFLSSRTWSVEDSFEVVNNLAKNSGEAAISEIRFLVDLMRPLEQQKWQLPEIKDLVKAFTKNAGLSPGGLFASLKYYIPMFENMGWNRPSLLEFLKTLSEKSHHQFG